MDLPELAGRQRRDGGPAIVSKWFAIALLSGWCWSAALADTPCPMVSDNVSILSVNVLGAPMPVGFAGLDLKTHYLTVSFLNRTSWMFIGVPVGWAQSFQTQLTHRL